MFFYIFKQKLCSVKPPIGLLNYKKKPKTLKIDDHVLSSVNNAGSSSAYMKHSYSLPHSILMMRYLWRVRNTVIISKYNYGSYKTTHSSVWE